MRPVADVVLPVAGMYLVFLAGSAEAFHQLSAARAWFQDQAGAAGLLQRLKAAAGLGPGARQRPGRGSADGSGRQQHQQQQQHLNVLSVESLPRPLGEPRLHGCATDVGLPASDATMRLSRCPGDAFATTRH